MKPIKQVALDGNIPRKSHSSIVKVKVRTPTPMYLGKQKERSTFRSISLDKFPSCDDFERCSEQTHPMRSYRIKSFYGNQFPWSRACSQKSPPCTSSTTPVLSPPILDVKGITNPRPGKSELGTCKSRPTI